MNISINMYLLWNIRKPDKSETDEDYTSCPQCHQRVPDYELLCPSCQLALPYCIVTVRNISLPKQGQQWNLVDI